MTNLPPDAGTACAALELDAGYLADLFRSEAGRVLRKAAELIDEGVRGDDPTLGFALRLIDIVDAFDEEWERHEGDDDEAGGRNGGDSLTPHPPPSSDQIVAESMRRIGGET